MTYGLTGEQVELMKGPRLSASFPIEFANGEVCGAPTVECPTCKQDIPDVLLKGTVCRPAAQVAVVEVGGYCDCCDRFVMTTVRLYDDGRTVQYRARRWEEIDAQQPSVWVRAKRLLLGDRTTI